MAKSTSEIPILDLLAGMTADLTAASSVRDNSGSPAERTDSLIPSYGTREASSGAVPFFVTVRSPIAPLLVGHVLRPGRQPRRTDPATHARAGWAT